MTTLSDFIAAINGGNDVTVNLLVGANAAGVPLIAKMASDGTLLISDGVNGGESSIAAGSGPTQSCRMRRFLAGLKTEEGKEVRDGYGCHSFNRWHQNSVERWP